MEGGFGAVDQDQVLGIDTVDNLGNSDSIGMGDREGAFFGEPDSPQGEATPTR